MCRSVIIKGLEAMVIESFTAARRYGVEEAVLASLRETFPGIDWEQQATYFFQRVIEHGRRRARRCARRPSPCARPASTRGARPAPPSAGLGRRPRRRGAVRQEARHAGSPAAPDWRVEADRILDHLKARRQD